MKIEIESAIQYLKNSKSAVTEDYSIVHDMVMDIAIEALEKQLNDDKLNQIATEAVKIHQDFPEMSYHWCVIKAKEVIAYEDNNKRDTSIK